MIIRLFAFVEFVMNAVFGAFSKAVKWLFLAFAIGATIGMSMFALGYNIAQR